MKFIADAMLGKLAKRLRLLGIDVLYDPSCPDNELIRRALEEDRVILTRDTRLASRPVARRHLLISGDRVEDQVGQVLASADLSAAPLTRCSVCNALLQPAGREEVADLVPRHVYDQAHAFLRCPDCRRVYWKGSHLKRMDDGLWKRKRPAS